jgi:hypothetical protein
LNFPNATAFSVPNSAVLNNQSGGITNVQGSGSITKITGADVNLNNAGTFNQAAGTFQLVGVVFNNTNATNITAGALQLASTSYSQTSGTTTLNGGNLQAASTSVAGGVVKGVNTITGTTNAAALSVSGTGRVQPGTSAGILSASGNGTASYSQSSTAFLDVEIGGTTVGTQYDQLNLSNGAAALDGTLKVTLINGFNPALGNSFTVVTSTGAIAGAFATVDTSAAPLGAFLSRRITYNANSVVLDVASPAADQREFRQCARRPAERHHRRAADQ